MYVNNEMIKVPKIDLHGKSVQELENLTGEMSNRELLRAASQKNEHGDNLITYANCQVTQFFAKRLLPDELYRLALEIDNNGNNAVTEASAQKTQIFSERLSASYFKELVSHHNSFNENALFYADEAKTQIIAKTLARRGDGKDVMLKLASQESRFYDNAMNSSLTSESKINAISTAIPLGSNLFGIIDPEKDDIVRDHITRPQQILDLIIGKSDRSEALKKDYENNPEKYIEYAVNIGKSHKLSTKIKDDKVSEALSMVADYKNENLNTLHDCVEKSDNLPTDAFSKIAKYVHYLDME